MKDRFFHLYYFTVILLLCLDHRLLKETYLQTTVIVMEPAIGAKDRPLSSETLSNIHTTSIQDSTLLQIQKPSRTWYENILWTLRSHAMSFMGMYYSYTDFGIPAEILPGFYLGSIGAAHNKKYLTENEIENILNCCDGIIEAYPKDFRYRNLELADEPGENITRYFEEVTDYIHDILTQGKKVLVHCYGGRSRSVTMIISYLVRYHNMTVDEALERIKLKKADAQPNTGFWRQLKAYEKGLKKKLI